MASRLKVFFSNRLELLFEQLKMQLFPPGSPPFTRRCILVPSPAMKSWLMLRMACDPRLNIATGVEITYLDQGIERLSSLACRAEHGDGLSRIELTLAIESELRHAIASMDELSTAERLCWDPLFKYLHVTSSLAALSLKAERRLIWLSDRLAALFIQYGKYGGGLLEEWEGSTVSGWQQYLWRKLFVNRWNYPYKALSSVHTVDRRDLQVHLFALSHFPQAYHRFLEKLSIQIPVSYYQLSPCSAYWLDLRSDEERCRLQGFLEKKGLPVKKRGALDEYLRDNNPLLANFGRMGREMADRIDLSDPEVFEEYAIAENALSHSAYAELATHDLHTVDIGKSLSLLDVVQTDMLLLRNPATSPQAAINAIHGDDSIQVHAAHTPLREVQILHNLLLTILDRHAGDPQPILPGDILVMAPDIQSYAPYIGMVFRGQESLLKPYLLEASTPAENSLVKAFIQLLELPYSRWEAATLLQILSSSWFQRRLQFNLEDVQTIQEWVQLTDVRWGTDVQHRNALLKRDHSEKTMVDDTTVGTWEHGIERLMSCLIVQCEGSLQAEEVAPTQAELLGAWVQVLRSLHTNLASMHDAAQRPLQEWVSFLRYLCSTYLLAEEEQGTCEEWGLLNSVFDSLCFAQNKLDKNKLGEMTCSFSAVKQRLLTLFNTPEERYREADLNAVRFCSLLPMRAIPAAVVVMLGLKEGAFPRTDHPSSLDLMHKSGKSDYCPSQTDYDRFLFLEALLSARRYFFMIYEGYSPEGKEQPPALPVTELLSYLDRACSLNGQPPSQSCIYRHPLHPFDSLYFDGVSRFRSYSALQYTAARARYQAEAKRPADFLPAFTPPPPPTLQKEIRIQLKDLIAFAANPLKTYFNHTLGIYLEPRHSYTHKEAEEFLLHPLEAASLRKQSFKRPIEEVLYLAEQQGRMPIGPFKQVVVNKLKEEVGEYYAHLEAQGLPTSSFFDLSLNEKCRNSSQLAANHWEAPMLTIPCSYGQVEIVGTLQNLSAQGMVLQTKKEKIEPFKAWPAFLVMLCAGQRSNIPLGRQLVLVNHRKVQCKEPFFEDANRLLAVYLDYYLASLEAPSPLIPEWIPLLLTQTSAECLESIHESIANPFSGLYNDYLKWAVREVPLLLNETFLEQWKPPADALFAALHTHWCASPKQRPPADEDL